MAIEFFNIKSRERRVCDTEPMISAFWGSSNLSPNATKGQDMGWRLAPKIVAQIDKIRKEPELLKKISQAAQIPEDNLTDTDLLWYISNEEARANRITNAESSDFTDEYEAEVRKAKGIETPVVKTEEQIRAEVRAEMEAEARAKAEEESKSAEPTEPAKVVVAQPAPAKIDVKVEEKTEKVNVRAK